ncbi:hypothetical protein BDZ91DRAFT_799158 [Kalaharituber pfeilii]|nr:hypothetical protein BDZ91DRAFT_799158 [Kalaharituber pfeilii]
MVAEKADVEAMVAVVNYAFGNLPFSSSNPKIISVPREPLLKYFAHYTSWALDVFTTSEAFCDLLVQCPDFAQALVLNSNPARRPPWVDAVSQGSDGEVVKPPEVSVTSEEDKSHILSRHCSNCDYVGVMSIMCKRCDKVDLEIGVVVVTTVPMERIRPYAGRSGTHRLSWKGKVVYKLDVDRTVEKRKQQQAWIQASSRIHGDIQTWTDMDTHGQDN